MKLANHHSEWWPYCYHMLQNCCQLFTDELWILWLEQNPDEIFQHNLKIFQKFLSGLPVDYLFSSECKKIDFCNYVSLQLEFEMDQKAKGAIYIRTEEGIFKRQCPWHCRTIKKALVIQICNHNIFDVEFAGLEIFHNSCPFYILYSHFKDTSSFSFYIKFTWAIPEPIRPPPITVTCFIEFTVAELEKDRLKTKERFILKLIQ